MIYLNNEDYVAALIEHAKGLVASLTADINATPHEANKPERKALVFQRRRLNKIIHESELLLSSLRS